MSTHLPDALIVLAGDQPCALPLSAVGECLRPLPVRKLADVPAYVRGLSTIRGEAVPVLDLGLLVAGRSAEPTRFVTVRSAHGPVALAVTAVEGVARLGAGAFESLPPAVSGAASGALSGLAVRDGEVLALLAALKLVPEELWPRLAGATP